MRKKYWRIASIIPKLSIQPIVENAIYHGLEMKVGQGVIGIQVKTVGDMVLIRVEDDGLGMDDDKLSELQRKLAMGVDLKEQDTEDTYKNCMGIYNVNERIKLAFGDEYGLSIYSTPNVGTIVEMLMPIRIAHASL